MSDNLSNLDRLSKLLFSFAESNCGATVMLVTSKSADFLEPLGNVDVADNTTADNPVITVETHNNVS